MEFFIIVEIQILILTCIAMKIDTNIDKKHFGISDINNLFLIILLLPIIYYIILGGK